MTDAKVFASAIYAVVHHPQKFAEILAPLARIAHPSHPYTTPQNVLSALVVHTNPVSTPIADILKLAAEICQEFEIKGFGESLPDLESYVPDSAKLESFLSELVSNYSLSDDDSDSAIFISSDQAAVEISQAFVEDLRSRARSLGFDPLIPQNPDLSSTFSDQLLVSFVKAKCLHTSQFFPEISAFFDGFRALDHVSSYISWVHGVIHPYNFYTSNYKVPNDICTPAGDFLQLKSHHDQFNYLVEPLAQGSKPMDISAARYLAGTVLPLAIYYNGDLSELSNWTIQNYTSGSLADFRFWHDLLMVLMQYMAYDGTSVPIESYSVLIRQYIGMCLFYGLGNSTLGPLEYSHVQDQILSTIQYLLQQLNVEQKPSCVLVTNSKDIEVPETFSQFLSLPHPLVSTIFKSDLSEILSDFQAVVSTCCTLYPLNELTIKKYFHLKSETSGNWVQKETLSILSKVETASYERMTSAIEGLKKSFISSPSSAEEIDQVIFERLLQLDSYDQALNFLQTSSVSCAVTFPLARGRFWELLESASNLDDRIGKLKLAQNCLETMAQLAQTEQHQDQVIRIRHLFKALHNLKNFKLVLHKNQPITPKHILEKLTMISSEDKFPPISLIAIILEQNPKSYLAYEKLYKVVNDLAIYLDLNLGEISFPKVQSACVESALIDSNFSFAFKHSKELLEYFVESGRTDELSDLWLMFYQVGKYISADWFNEYNEKVQKEKIAVLYQQREILSMAIKHSTPHRGSVDNSRLLVGQFKHINSEIQKWHHDAKQHRSENLNRAVKTTQMQIHENLSGILSEATISKRQAGEKLTNLLTSGLGWAIGADR